MHLQQVYCDLTLFVSVQEISTRIEGLTYEEPTLPTTESSDFVTVAADRILKVSLARTSCAKMTKNDEIRMSRNVTSAIMGFPIVQLFPKTFYNPVVYKCSCSYKKGSRRNAKNTDGSFHCLNDRQEPREKKDFR